MTLSTPRSVEQAESFSVPRVGMKIFVKPEERQRLGEIPVVLPDQFELSEIHLVASSLKIIEIGEGDKEGLLKVNLGLGRRTLRAQDVWVQTSSLLESGLWKIDRRRGNPLEGDRLDEIRTVDEVHLRRGDVKRKVLLLAKR